MSEAGSLDETASSASANVGSSQAKDEAEMDEQLKEEEMEEKQVQQRRKKKTKENKSGPEQEKKKQGKQKRKRKKLRKTKVDDETGEKPGARRKPKTPRKKSKSLSSSQHKKVDQKLRGTSAWANLKVSKSKPGGGPKRQPLAELQGIDSPEFLESAEFMKFEAKGDHLQLPAASGSISRHFYAHVEKRDSSYSLNLYNSSRDPKAVQSFLLEGSSCSILERGACLPMRGGYFFGLREKDGSTIHLLEAETPELRRKWIALLVRRGSRFKGVSLRRVFPNALAEGFLRMQVSKRFKSTWESPYCVVHDQSLVVYKDRTKAHSGKDHLTIKLGSGTIVTALKEEIDAHAHCFQVQASNKKPTIFACIDQTDQEFWISVLSMEQSGALPPPPPSVSDLDLMKETPAGWMYKTGASGTGWRHRYCVLTPGSDETWMLRYFKEHVANPASKKGQGSVPVPGAVLRRYGRGVFPRVLNSYIWTIQPVGSKRQFTFECPTEKDRSEWLEWLVARGAQPPQDIELEPILKTSAKEGYMEKMGGTKKASGWKVRYFVIDKRDKCIRYYSHRDKAARSTESSLRTLPLCSDTTLSSCKEPVLGKDYVFKVILPSGSREWLFSVADEEDRRSWLNALQSVVGLDAAALLALAQQAKKDIRRSRTQTDLTPIRRVDLFPEASADAAAVSSSELSASALTGTALSVSSPAAEVSVSASTEDFSEFVDRNRSRSRTSATRRQQSPDGTWTSIPSRVSRTSSRCSSRSLRRLSSSSESDSDSSSSSSSRSSSSSGSSGDDSSSDSSSSSDDDSSDSSSSFSSTSSSSSSSSSDDSSSDESSDSSSSDDNFSDSESSSSSSSSSSSASSSSQFHGSEDEDHDDGTDHAPDPISLDGKEITPEEGAPVHPEAGEESKEQSLTPEQQAQLEREKEELTLSGTAWRCLTEDSSGLHYWVCSKTNRMSWLKPVDLDDPESDFERGEQTKLMQDLVRRALDPATRSVFRGVKDVTDFRDILGCEEGRVSFMQFLISEYSSENLKFWTAAEDLVQRFSAEALASLDLREWSGLVQSIFETYVLPDAEELINISSDTSRSMVLAFEDFQGSSDSDKRELLAKVMEEIENGRTAVYELMAKDSFGRYILSDLFESFVRDYHAALSKLELRTMTEAAELHNDSGGNQELYNRLTSQSTRCSVLNCEQPKERANFCTDHSRMFVSQHVRRKGNFFSALKAKKDKTRFQEHGFDLDLGYVTSNLINMSFPEEGGLRRNNPIAEVREYLKLSHENNFQVYNFSTERFDPDTYKSGGGNYAHYPCEENHPPRLEDIVEFCEDAAQWLGKSHEHVVVCHCRTNLGRSATMMACLLLQTKQKESVLEALQAVADVRMQDGNIYKMVTPSQRQYVYNFFRLVQQPELVPHLVLTPPAMRLKRIQLSPVPKFDRRGGCCPRILIYSAHPQNEELYDSAVLYEQSEMGPLKAPEFSQDDKQVTMHCLRQLNSTSYVMVKGDFKLFIYHQRGRKKILMLSTSLHTSFLSEELHVIPKQELDHASADLKNENFADDFILSMHLEMV